MDPNNTKKLTEYNDKLDLVKGEAAKITTDDLFNTEFKKLPLIVEYQPRVGGKSRHKNNKNNKKNNKSRRRNQSKRQRK
jgi:hypothetical protein